MRAANLFLATPAILSLSGCASLKSLPFGNSFELLNSPAMKVAKVTPPIIVTDRDRSTFVSRGESWKAVGASTGSPRASGPGGICVPSSPSD